MPFSVPPVPDTDPTHAAAPLPHPVRRLVKPALLLMALALLLAGGVAGWRHWRAAADGPGAWATVTATRGDIEDSITATGTVQPKDYVDVGTQVSGQLRSLKVELGAQVRQGQLLAEIDPSVYQSRVDADRAQLRNQRAQLADRQAQAVLAKLQLARQQQLARDDATTQEAVQTAEATLQSANAQVESLRAQIEQTESTLRGDEANLGYTKISAPMSGTVVSLAAKQGQTLNANQQAPIVMRIADLSAMTVQAQVSEADVGKLNLGMPVYFTTLAGDNRRFSGALRQVSPTPNVVNNVVLYDALFDVPNPDQVLKTQMTAQVFFVAAAARDAVLVPVAALRPLGRGEGAGAGAGDRRGRGAAASAAASGSASAAGDVASRVGASEGGSDTPAAADSAKPTHPPAPTPTTASAAGRAASGANPRRAGGLGQAQAGIDARASFAGRRARLSVLDARGQLVERTVRVGVVNRVMAEIVDGVQAGEQVVTGRAVVRQGTGPSTGPTTGGGAAASTGARSGGLSPSGGPGGFGGPGR